MKTVLNKTNADANAIYARLKEVRLSSHDRMLAEANLARAEAIAEILAAGFKAGREFLARLVVRPLKRLTASIG